ILSSLRGVLLAEDGDFGDLHRFRIEAAASLDVGNDVFERVPADDSEAGSGGWSGSRGVWQERLRGGKVFGEVGRVKHHSGEGATASPEDVSSSPPRRANRG